MFLRLPRGLNPGKRIAAHRIDCSDRADRSEGRLLEALVALGAGEAQEILQRLVEPRHVLEELVPVAMERKSRRRGPNLTGVQDFGIHPPFWGILDWVPRVSWTDRLEDGA